MPTKDSTNTADNRVGCNDNKSPVSISISREDDRKEAKARIRFTEGAKWPSDWLGAFAPESVDVETTAKTLRAYFDLDERLPDTESPSVFDDETRRAVIVLLRCLCQEAKEEALCLAGAPLGPSEADIAKGTNSFPDGSWHLMPVNSLWEKLCRYCFRLGWEVPRTSEPIEIRTPHQALEFIRAVETSIGERNEELTGTWKSKSEPAAFFGQMNTSQVSAVDSEYVFRPDGNGYFIRGLGEEGRVFAKGAKGLHDIFRLIQSASVPVPMLELDAGAGTKRLPGDSRSKQFVANQQTKQDIAAKRKQLQADLAKADSELERAELQDELDELNTEATKLFGIGGKPRDLNDPTGRLRSKLLSRITTACQRMKDEGLKELGSHFDLTIGSEGGCLVYRPSLPNIIWDTEPRV